MKKLLSSVVSKVVNSVKTNVDTGIAVYKATVAVRNDFLGNGFKHIDDIGGYKVFLNDDYVTASTGLPDVANAIALTESSHGPCIIVNSLLADFEYRNAIMQHEIGHLKLKHVANRLYKWNLMFAMGEGIEMEFQADAYSVSQGEDMLGALKALYKDVPSKALEVRIARLEANA